MVTDSAGGSASQNYVLQITATPLTVVSISLPSGEATAPYVGATLSATGGTLPYKSWAVTSGTLPAGLMLSPNGSISGTLSAAATTANGLVFTVTDSNNATGSSQPMTLTVTPGPSIAGFPSNGNVNVSYSTTLTASGGTPGYTWSISNGALPPGLSLPNPPTSGQITGTPASSGAFHFTAKVTDSVGGYGSQNFTITINSTITISTSASLPQGEVGAPYSQTLGVADGNGILTWSLANGSSLPSGVTLSFTGTISGSPTFAGLFNFTVQVSDSNGGSASKSFSLTIIAGPTIITSATLPNGTVGLSYGPVTLVATGGTPSYTWSIIAGALPAGLNFTGTATSAGISGTPTASGTFNFTFQVSDAKGVTGTKQFVISTTSGLTIVTSPSLAAGSIGQLYTVTLAAAGGKSPYTWTLTSGSLPSGLALSGAGVLSGTPSASGNFNFTVQVTDSNSVKAEQAFTLTIASPLTITSARSLPSGTVGSSYIVSLGASGGTPPYIWSISSGNLPAGVTLTPVGTIIGTPAGAGTFSFTVTIADSAKHQASQAFSLVIASGVSILTPAQLPNASVNNAYSQSLSATGGTPPYSWSVISGKLPLGLALSPSGMLTGSPATNGSFIFIVQVTDNIGHNASTQFSLSVGSGLTITSYATLPPGAPGQAYTSLQLAAVGGSQPYTWAIIAGTIAPGLSLSTGGAIKGTPTTTGTFTFTVQVTDGNSATATHALTIFILPPALPQVNISGIPDTATSAQQINFTVALATGYPLAIAGTVTLSFASDAMAPTDDPAIQFSTGGRTANFTIPANSSNAVFSAPQIALQTGTVAGTITLVFTFSAGGTELASSGLTRTITIAQATPSIAAVKIVTSSNSFQVQVTGFSSPRELTEADLTFTPVSGASLQTTSATIDLTAVGKQWFQGSASVQYGSQFILVLPFTATQGNISAVASATVTLKNSMGASHPSSANF
jgi:hypothetical protein